MKNLIVLLVLAITLPAFCEDQEALRRQAIQERAAREALVNKEMQVKIKGDPNIEPATRKALEDLADKGAASDTELERIGRKAPATKDARSEQDKSWDNWTIEKQYNQHGMSLQPTPPADGLPSIASIQTGEGFVAYALAHLAIIAVCLLMIASQSMKGIGVVLLACYILFMLIFRIYEILAACVMVWMFVTWIGKGVVKSFTPDR